MATNPYTLARQSIRICSVNDLLEVGANVNATTNLYLTPHHIDGLHGHGGVVAELIDRCANLNAVENDSYTPLFCACVDDGLGVVKELLKHPEVLLTVVNNIRRTALGVARDHDIVAYSLSN